jgi:hypothetical protein
MIPTEEQKIAAAARQACGEQVSYQGFYAVCEKRGARVWQGIVHLLESPHARIYVWATGPIEEQTYVAALRGLSVDSAPAAVRAWLEEPKKAPP